MIIIPIVAFLAGLADVSLKSLFIRGTQDTLETQVNKTIQALQANSQEAAKLTSRLQTEVSNRTQALKELEIQLGQLRQQKTLLDLTPEQRNAIQALLKKPQTLGEIYTSTDFWFGRVLVSVLNSTIFFMLGIFYQRRKAARLLNAADQKQNSTNDQ